MELSTVFLIVVGAGIVFAVRRLALERPLVLFQGMFRYDADLGWPQGVQEDDGERAWVPRAAPSSDEEANERAWASIVGTSTISDRDGDRPLVPVPVVRVEGATSMAPR